MEKLKKKKIPTNKKPVLRKNITTVVEVTNQPTLEIRRGSVIFE